MAGRSRDGLQFLHRGLELGDRTVRRAVVHDEHVQWPRRLREQVCQALLREVRMPPVQQQRGDTARIDAG